MREPRPDADTTLALQAGAGDLEATTALLRRLGPRLKRVVAMVLGGGHAEFDDVVQQSMIAVVQALPAYRAESQPASYASRIAARTAVAAKRRCSVSLRRHQQMALDAPDVTPVPTPSDESAAARRRRVTRELLDELSLEQAETLALRFMLGCSLGEVAEATQVPVNTVRSRLRLAKAALRKRIESDARLADELEVER